MKIGILTVPFNNNYGGLLQAFALKRVLVDMGHEVIFVNRRRNKSKGLKARLKNFLISLHIVEDRRAKKIQEISAFTNQFKQKYLSPITEEYFTTNELSKCLDIGIDCFVVGSDQVWRYRYAKDSIDDFFFNFLENTSIPRFSYAASMGTDEMEYPQDKIAACSKLLTEFSSVSVRESSALGLLKTYFGYNNAKVVLDPTLLLDKQQYVDLFKDAFPQLDKKYVFIYILDETEEIKIAIDTFAKEKKMDVVDLKAQTGDWRKWKTIEHVEKWLSAIYYSEYVITDSFHGTVFSIIFNKPFITIANLKRGAARLSDLLQRFQLNNRLTSSVSGMGKLLNSDINWEAVNEIWDSERKFSFEYLECAFKLSADIMLNPLEPNYTLK